MSDPNDTAKDAAQPAGQTTSGGFFSQAPASEEKPAADAKTTNTADDKPAAEAQTAEASKDKTAAEKEPPPEKEADSKDASASMGSASAKDKKNTTRFKHIPIKEFIDANIEEDRQRKWSEFFKILGRINGKPITFPATGTPELIEEFDKLIFSTRFGTKLPFMSRTVQIGADTDLKIIAGNVSMKKGEQLTPEHAYAMALIMYANPDAQKYGVTLNGNTQDRQLFLLALKQVNRLHPNGLQIRINNPGMSAAVEVEAEAKPTTSATVAAATEPEVEPAFTGPRLSPEIIDKLCAATDIKTVFDAHPEIKETALYAAKRKLATMQGQTLTKGYTDEEAYDFLNTNKTDRRSTLDMFKAEGPDATVDTKADASAETTAAPEDLAKSFGMASGDTTAEKKEPAAEPAQKKAKPPVSGITDEMRLRAWNYVVITQDPTQKGLREALDIGATRARALIDWLEKQGVVGPQPENSFERRKVRVQPKEDFLAAARNSDGTDKYAVAKEMLARRKDNSGPGAQPA